MNLVKKVKEFKINDRDYIMTFDMRSIPVYKELTGKSFLQSSAQLGQFDDEITLGFMGATIRKKEKSNEPIGKTIYEMDVLYLLLNHAWDVIEIVTSSMPQSNGAVKTGKK